MLIKLFKFIAIAVLMLVLILGINTWRNSSKQLVVQPLPELKVDANLVSEHLAGAVRPRTIFSFVNEDQGAAEFQKLHRHMEASFPNLHRVLKREVVNGQGLLYTWVGKDAKAKPILLLAHQDVVPIAPGTETLWQQPPFDGVRKDGFVWGRGAWDNKSNLVSQMEAVEMLIVSGFQPERTVYLALTHDEEVARRDAEAIAKLLNSRGIKLDLVLDEGLMVLQGVLSGIEKPVAMIGIAEKGYRSVHFKTTTAPGHSSMPPPMGTSAIARMSEAMDRLEHHPFPAKIGGVAREMLETVAPEMEGLNRIALSNLWLFEPLVKRQLEQTGGSGNAMLRTTTALTIFHAGNKENVLPAFAEATINFRLLPGDTEASVMAHINEVIEQDKIEVKMSSIESSDATPVMATDTPNYRLLNRTVREIFPDAIVAPGLMVAATDSAMFTSICENIYKFSPIRAKKEELSRFHGTNERISESNLAEMVRFYHRFLSVTAGPSAAK